MKFTAVLIDEDQLFCDQQDMVLFTNIFEQFERFTSSSPEECIERLAQADVVITNGTPLTREILRQSTRLKLILIGGTGYDYVDIQAAQDYHIAVYHCQDYGSDSIAQHTLALILSLTNGIVNFQKTIRSSQWQEAETFCLLSEPIIALNQQCLVIVGYGSIGQRVKKLAEAFGMKVLLTELPGRPVRSNRLTLEEALPLADIVSIHCPLNEDTVKLFSAERLALMKPTAYLINTARGAIVDEEALVSALHRNQLAGVGVDVFSKEPLPAEHPLLSAELSHKVIATPHIAWASAQARRTMLLQLIENVGYFQAGQATRRVI